MRNSLRHLWHGLLDFGISKLIEIILWLIVALAGSGLATRILVTAIPFLAGSAIYIGFTWLPFPACSLFSFFVDSVGSVHASHESSAII